MNIERYESGGKEITFYLSQQEDQPLIVLNNFSGDAKTVVLELLRFHTEDFNLLSIGNLQWDHDMSPWYCEPIMKGDAPCTGGALAYLDLLVSRILPEALDKVQGTPAYTGIAGYSLAGLFALYAMYQTDVFDRVATMSGSFWFPGFKNYVFTHTMKRKPEKVYLSLGDKEARTGNKVLNTVQSNTEEIVEYLRRQSMKVEWELNPGNHFQQAALRSAKGIAALLKD